MSYNQTEFSKLPPLSLSSTKASSSNLSMAELPPLSPRPRLVDPATNSLPAKNLSMLGLPPVPLSPKASPVPLNGVIALPKVYSSGPVSVPSSGLSMTDLPPLSPRVSLPSPISSLTSSPVSTSIDFNMASFPAPPASPLAPSRPEERVYLPSMSVPVHKVWPQLTPEEHLEDILDLPLYDIPTLEEVLSKTTQPALRKKLQRMIDEQRQYEGRGSATRGWSGTKPARGRPRHQLMTQCGPSCFLDPANEKFPICPKCQLGDGKCSCAIDCRGVTAAKIRAKQWGYESIAELADKLLKEKCGKSSSPKSPRLPRSPRSYTQY